MIRIVFKNQQRNIPTYSSKNYKINLTQMNSSTKT